MLAVVACATLLVAWQSLVVQPAAVRVNGVASSAVIVRLRENDLLTIFPAIRGARVRYLVEFAVDGGVAFWETGEGGAAISAVRSDSAPASRVVGGRRRVQTTFVATDSFSRLVVRARSSDVTISDLHVRILRRTPLQPWDDTRTVIALGLLAIGTIGVWRFQSNKEASQRVIVITAVSILAVSTPIFGAVVLALLACLFRLGRLMQRPRARRSVLLWAAVAAIVVVVGGWKYSQPLFGFLFLTSLGTLAAPFGASFFLLRLVDAQFRWYRGEEADVSFREYITYAIFPATLIAGPMETLRGFRAKRSERITQSDVAAGAGRMVIGLAKKLIIGDFFLYRLLYGGRFALYDRAVLVGGGKATVEMLCAAFLFAAIDISAYADMAIGLARMHGYGIREDSNWPILASSLRDFWRRWHVSVAEWCMANVYVPILIGTRSVSLALFLTMLAMGVWHQLTWSWMLWAAHFTLGLLVANWMSRTIRVENAHLRVLGGVATRVLVLCFVISAHAFMQSDDVGVALKLYSDFWLAPWR